MRWHAGHEKDCCCRLHVVLGIICVFYTTEKWFRFIMSVSQIPSTMSHNNVYHDSSVVTFILLTRRSSSFFFTFSFCYYINHHTRLEIISVVIYKYIVNGLCSSCGSTTLMPAARLCNISHVDVVRHRRFRSHCRLIVFDWQVKR